jgi:hypothetical protein
VARFVRTAAERLQTPLEAVGRIHKLPVAHLPEALRERLAALGIEKPYRVSFREPAPAGAAFLHRTHPLVTVLADYVAEQALADEESELASRCAALFTDDVAARTELLLLRVRHQVLVERLEAARVVERRSLLAEECLTVQVQGDAVAMLDEAESVRLMSAEPSRNMVPEQRAQQVGRTLGRLEALQPALTTLAQERAAQLLADHTRVREAGRGGRGALVARYDVQPSLPVDVIGVYVLIPTPSL